VSSTPDLQVLGRRLAARRPRQDVVELEEPTRATQPPVFRHESALPSVSPVHLARYRRRDISTRLSGPAEALGVGVEVEVEVEVMGLGFEAARFVGRGFLPTANRSFSRS
jgi:hypothetical protein